jgi:protein TonB
MKKISLCLLIPLALLSACSTYLGGSPGRDTSSNASSLNAYKVDVAQRISSANAGRVYQGRPQALLRAVIVLKYQVDGNGNLVRTEIFRSNGDRAAESTALASLQNSQPLPRPASHLLHRGRVEANETWLFNDDGRFQLRSIAQAQMGE